MEGRRLHCENYVVGWVCALPVELAAAQDMLDEEHQPPPRNDNDSNIYTLGRIGEHNVVMVCLPAGQIGTNSAAAVVGQMKAKFSSIQHILMVGIGGGVPSVETDIRLGDVVVSQPHMGRGGVVQYDLGKSTPSGFVRTGFLNAPPPLLLGAISKLQANKAALQAKLSTALSAFSHLRNNAGPDLLFEPTYEHVEGPECNWCSNDQLVQRTTRGGQEIMVHYGTIASGNQVLRHGVTRDKLSSELGGVLCFEMEAAGLMNTAPCLVIRGICDYSDSHKNKRWQPYAATTAAAYAKELLSVIPAADVTCMSCGLEPDLLKLLPVSREAAFNSYEKRHDAFCLGGTRVDVLNEIYAWADRESGQRIFWLNGMAGTGKSTIARTVARKFSEEKKLGASFFFSRCGIDVGHAGRVFTTIAWQLANSSAVLHRHIREAIRENRDIASQTLRDQWNKLILSSLTKLEARSIQPSLIIVIDALDECEGDSDIRLLLDLLAEPNNLNSIRFRVFVTSRPDTPIRLRFRAMHGILHRDLILDNISPAIVDSDISLFLADQFMDITENSEYLPPDWPGVETIDALVRKADGLFIYAATMCRFIKTNDEWSPQRLLEVFLPPGDPDFPRNRSHAVPSISPTAELDAIYMQILKHSVRGFGDGKDREELVKNFKRVIGSIVILSEPLSACALARLLNNNQEMVHLRLRHLRSVLKVPDNPDSPIRILHPSFRDFLLSKERCCDLQFLIDEKTIHQLLATCCLERLSCSNAGLKRDICELKRPGVLTTEINISLIMRHLPAELQYACEFWAHHLHQSWQRLDDNGQVHKFLRQHFLHWLEVLALIGKTSQGIRAIGLLERMTDANESACLHVFIHDAKRFLLYSRSIIEEAPLQTYCSALVFVPQQSLVRKLFEKEIPNWIERLPEVQSEWGPLLQTLEGHTGDVNAVAFSPDGRVVASASDDKTVRLWDAATGASLQTLEGHMGDFSAVAFSPDGKMVASASGNETVRLRDTATGAVLQKLEGHTDFVSAVVFSPDGKMVASASGDETVRLWDTVTGAVLQTLKGHTDFVSAVIFSPDSKTVASASDDETVRLWDTVTGAVLQTIKGHTDFVSAVAFSPDGKVIASASSNETVWLSDPTTGAALQTLEGHTSNISAVAFSPDGKVVASASGDQTVRLWDVATGAALQALEAHTGWVNDVAFSPDGKMVASASGDKTVRLWDVVTGAALQVLEGHTGRVNAIAFSPDVKVLASASYDETVRLWDIAMGAALRTLEGHTSDISAVVFSPDGKMVASASWDKTVWLWDVATGTTLPTLKYYANDTSAVAFSPDGKTVASASGYETVQLWDAVTGVPLQTLDGHTSIVSAVAFSPDGRVVASASGDKTVRLWDAATGATLQTLEGHTEWVSAIAFSPDGKMVASASGDKTVRLWDTVTCAALQTLEGHMGDVSAIVFSPDGKVVASASYDKTIRLWDAATGVGLQMFEGCKRCVHAVAFSPNGRVVASASDDKMVRFWDAATGAALQTLEGHTSVVKATAFSPDGKVVASASWDGMVRLWDATIDAAPRTLESHTSDVGAVVFSPDGKVVASVSRHKTVQLWDAATGAALQTLEGHTRWVRAIAFSPDGKVVASASWDKMVRLWDVVTGTTLQTLEHTGWVNAVVFSMDGKVVASVPWDKTVRLWDPATGAALQTLEGHTGDINVVTFSLDGKVVASASKDKTVRLWDPVTGAALQTLEGHMGDVSAIVFSPDSKVVASASDDKTVRLWGTVTGAVLQTFKGHTSFVRAVAFSADGKVIASASWDKTVQLWDAATGAALITFENCLTDKLFFSREGPYVETNRGSLCIQSNCAGTLASKPQTFRAVCLRGNWITQGDEKLLWLPPDYRPACSASKRNLLVFGYRPGGVIFIEFGSC